MDRSVLRVFLDMDRRHFWRRSKRALVLREASRRLAGVGEPQIVDIGSSLSLMPLELRRLGRLVCVEPDPETIELAAEEHGLELVQGRLPDGLPQLPEADLVTLLDVLEHVEDDAGSAAALFSILKPGGHLICTVPAYQWMWSRHDVSLHHKRRYSRPEVCRLLREAGFEVARATYYTTLMLPAAVAMRIPGKLFRRRNGESKEYTARVPALPLNAFCGMVMGIERGLLRVVDLPFGLNVLAVARRPDSRG